MLAALRRLVGQRKLSKRVAGRKLRLFAVAQYRQLRPAAEVQATCDALVQVAEQHAEGRAGRAKLEEAYEEADNKFDISWTGFLESHDISWAEPEIDVDGLRRWAARDLAYFCTLLDPWDAAGQTAEAMVQLALRQAAKEQVAPPEVAPAHYEDMSEYEDALLALVPARGARAARARPAGWLREVFGNPFAPAPFDPAWRTATVSALAEGVYADRAFDRLPVLADALEEAGCSDAELLHHCRERGRHDRGCWALDRVRNRG
jgi:hypothetical protein